MSFPLSIEGHFQVARGDADDDFCAQILERAKGALREVSDNVAVRGERVISQRGLLSSFLPTGGHTLAFIDSVFITVADNGNSADVSYVLGTASVCYLWTTLVFGAALFQFVSGLGQAPLVRAGWSVASFLVAWGWMVGVTYFLAWAQAPAWLKRKLA